MQQKPRAVYIHFLHLLASHLLPILKNAKSIYSLSPYIYMYVRKYNQE